MALDQDPVLPMGILPDWEISRLANEGMIEPFERSLVREVEVQGPDSVLPQPRKVISFGPSSYGYDIRLSPKDFRIFRHIPGTVIDPKNFNPQNLESVQLHSDRNGEFFIIPAHSYGLGVSLERFNLPRDVTTIAIGKSTYARCSLIANVTPFEAGWCGHPTLEFSNGSSADVRIYANEGCLQILFLRGENCRVSYGDRQGKYQSQGHEVVLARV
ncbi:MAG TPA: dCTP deaminase [Coleofasciculaceae cyanobacterium]